MIADDGRMPMVEDMRDGKRKLDDFGTIYGIDHGQSTNRPINESPGKDIIIYTIIICCDVIELHPAMTY